MRPDPTAWQQGEEPEAEHVTPSGMDWVHPDTGHATASAGSSAPAPPEPGQQQYPRWEPSGLFRPGRRSRGVNWNQIYAEFMLGDPIPVIATRHGLTSNYLAAYARTSNWFEQRRRVMQQARQRIMDRLEDLTPDDPDQVVRVHFRLINETLLHVMNVLPRVITPKDAKEFVGALDTLLKAQRLTMGMTNYVADPNKGSRYDHDAAAELDAALDLAGNPVALPGPQTRAGAEDSDLAAESGDVCEGSNPGGS